MRVSHFQLCHYPLNMFLLSDNSHVFLFRNTLFGYGALTVWSFEIAVNEERTVSNEQSFLSSCCVGVCMSIIEKRWGGVID